MQPERVWSVFYALLIYTLQAVRAVRLPSDLNQDLYCAGCEAVVNEVHKLMLKKSSDPLEVKVVHALDDLCEPDNFRTYDYIPPKMIKACKFMLEQYDEDLEQLFIRNYRKRHPNQSDVEKAVCRGLTRACIHKPKEEGEKKEEKPKKSKIAFGDGDEMEIEYGDDAKIAQPVKEKKDEL